MPFALKDAQQIVEMGCLPTLAELDQMPVNLIENITLYRAIKSVVEFGGDLRT